MVDIKFKKITRKKNRKIDLRIINEFFNTSKRLENKIITKSIETEK